MAILNHNEIEREVSRTLKSITLDHDFIFTLPLEINAKTNGITFGVSLTISLYSEAFYLQIAFGDYKRSEFMQISFRLLIGEIKENTTLLPVINKLNTKLIYGKAILNEEGEPPYLTIEHDFAALNLEQVNEALYDFLNDIIDEDVSPYLEKIIAEMREE